MKYVTLKDIHGALTGATLPAGSVVSVLWEDPVTHRMSLLPDEDYPVFVANKEDIGLVVESVLN